MKKALISLAVTTMLANLMTGCVPAVLVSAGAATGAAIGRDSRSLQTMSDDTEIQFQAAQKLKNDPQTATGTNINVASFNRIVLLTGEVPSEAVRARAETDVQSIPKVRRVYNQLKIEPLIGVIQLGDDSRISANIKARMMVTSDLNSDNFKVVVENKQVYLMGYADKEQTKLALNVIRNSSGVSRVINLVEIKKEDGDDDDNSVASKSSAPVSSTTTTSVSAAPAPAPVTTPAPDANAAVTTGSAPEPLTMEPVASSST